MTMPYQLDQAWFENHPHQHVYQRAPLPEECQEYPVPQNALVTVHLITSRCTVRVLKLPTGQKVATVVDTEDQLFIDD